MAVNMTMPKWGLTMKEGKLSKWFKSENDTIEKGEPFFEVETEKITNAVESTASGVVFQIVVEAGATVPVGTIVAVVARDGEQPERIEGIQAGELVEGEPSAAAAATPAPAEKPAEKKFVPSSPAARRLAKELDVDITRVEGSGPKGRITETDVQRFHDEGPPPPKVTPLAAEMIRQEGLDAAAIEGTGEGGKITKEDVERVLKTRGPEVEAEAPKVIPLTGMRKAVADNMYASLQNTAQLTVFREVDVTEMVRYLALVRKEYRKDESVRVSYNDIIIYATARALKRFPIMNSTLVGDEILLHDSVNMGIAVAIPDGLIVPVLKGADRKGLLQIARETRELAGKAREGSLGVEEVTNGTFTTTNVSMFGTDGFTPILKPPETGILGIGGIKEKAAVHEGEIAIRSMMFLSLTFDHRVVDGAPANEFLATVARYLENPTLAMT